MTLIGRLAATPEVVPTSTGRDLIRYALGVNTGTRDSPETSWFRVSSFPQSENVKGLFTGLQKGQHMWIEADGKMSAFETGQGERRTRLELVQRGFELLGRPSTQSVDDRAQAANAMGSEAGDEAAVDSSR
ncbi:MAG: hypothetical protein Q9162_007369 [Coniocarpon cinnabarinum]